MTGLAVESLLDAVLVPENAVRHVNFFNGRVLTASDLKAQQVADRLGRQQLGRVIGAGVASGFEVALVADGTNNQPPIVRVTGGLAITESGQPIELSLSQVDVTLARSQPGLPLHIGLFDDCAQPPPPSDITGRGAYILVVSAASAYRDQAPMVRVGGNGIASGCGDAYAVEGAVFRLVEVPEDAFATLSQEARDEITKLGTEAEEQSLDTGTRRARLSRFRNVLAHACLGSERAEQFDRDPWGRSQAPATLTGGIVDAMRDGCELTAWDVPIALVYWTNRGVRFVDMWSVRRRPTHASGRPPVDDRIGSEGEARLLQFQEHVASIVGSTLGQSALNLVAARTHFRYLPAAGLIPLSDAPSERGFVYDMFVAGIVHRGREFIEGSGLKALLGDSLTHRRFDVDGAEALWTYEVRENAEAIATATGSPPQRVLVISSGQMEHASWARFDVARWDYANYAD